MLPSCWLVSNALAPEMQFLVNIKSYCKFRDCGPISYTTVNNLKRIRSFARKYIFTEGGSLSLNIFSKHPQLNRINIHGNSMRGLPVLFKYIPRRKGPF